MPTPSTRTPVRIARGSYSNLNGSVSDLQDGEISYAEDQNKLYVKEGSSLVALTYTPVSPTFTGTVTIPTPTAGDNSTKAASTAFVVAGFAPKAAPAFTGTATGVNLTLSGDLTVNGTTTTINTTNLDVEDKNITLGKVSSPSDTTADGGGITLKGATDKTWNWVDATDAWTSSEHIALPAGKRILLGTTTEGEGDADNLTIADSGNCGITIRAGSSNKSQIFFADGTSGNAEFEGTVQYDHSNNSLYFRTAALIALTISSSQNATFAGTVTDSKGELRKIPQNERNSAYTLVAADAGKHVSTNSAVTIPSGVFSVGDAITIYSYASSDIAITRSGVTLWNAADGTNADRTLSTRGLATLLCTATNTFVISGAGLS